jgi:hypothetical protein
LNALAFGSKLASCEEALALDAELDNGLNWSPSTRDFAVANATVGTVER